VVKQCTTAGWGCIDCKQVLAASLEREFAPIRERAKELEAKPKLVTDILAAGAARAHTIARETLREVKEIMGLA
jgi:tryptophanyl-tRNA synthetase